MNTLEEQLRESLHDYATRPRLRDDVAGTAIRRARLIRGRRTVVTSGLAVLAVVAVIGWVVVARPYDTPAPLNGTDSPTSSLTESAFSRYGVHLDVLEPGNTLRTTDARTFDLGSGQVHIVRVPYGWLIVDQTGNVRLLGFEGKMVPLLQVRLGPGLSRAVMPAVSADGMSIAWVGDGVLHAAGLSPDGLLDEHTTPVPANSFALTWIGPRVVVGQTTGTGCCDDSVQYDLWDPTQVGFVPHWTPGLAAIYGPTPGDVTAWANIRGEAGQGCLGELNGVTNMSVRGRACVDGLTYGSSLGLLAPDGLRLAELDLQSQMIMIIAVGRATPVVIGYCGADDPVAWEDDSDLIAWSSTTRRLVRCDMRTMTSTSTSGSAGPTFDPTLYPVIPRYGF